MHVIICGGRKSRIDAHGQAWLTTLGITHVRHGAAQGVDTDADTWASTQGIPSQAYPVTSLDWNTYGRQAGPARNREMLHELLEDRQHGVHIAVIAFPGGPGTANMCYQAVQAHVPVLHYQPVLVEAEFWS